MSSRHLPSFIVIGAMKCGTSSLYEYLSRHPHVEMSDPKEPSFFVHNRERSLEWYKNRFQGNAPVRGEASTHYTKYPIHKGVPERMHDLLPEAKLIYLVRPPIDRFLSHYVHNYVAEGERRSIEDTLYPLRDDNPYLVYGKYYTQVEKYLDYYPKDKIFIIDSIKLKKRKREVLESVFDFLGLDSGLYDYSFEFRKRDSSDLKAKTGIGRKLLKSSLVRELIQQVPSDFISWLKQPFEYAPPQPSLTEEDQKALKKYYRNDIKRLKSFTSLTSKVWEKY